MKYLFGLIFLASSFIQVHAGTFECSTSRGDLKLSQWSKSGGAAPAEGMLLSTTQWSYKENVIFEENVYHEVELPETLDSNIQWSIRHKSAVSIVRTNTGYSTHEIFVVQIDLKSSNGEVMTGMDVPSLIDWFICQKDNQLLP